MQNKFQIESLPVYWRVKKKTTISHSKIPEKLDISISTDPKTGAISQDLNKSLKTTLLNIYAEDENIGYLREDNKLAVGYHVDLSNFIKKNLKHFRVTNILEIGCGGCTVLEELKNMDYKVTGLDPSPFAAKCAEERNIPLIQDFFKPELIDKDYDLVFFSDVLEHVFDPVEFLENLSKSLNNDSIIIIAVPDATSESISGDYSMLMHQHISYFTEDTLRNTILHTGLSCLHIEKAGYGGSLYAIAQVNKGCNNITNIVAFNQSYFNRAWQTQENFLELFERIEKQYSKILCYVPLRAIPYLTSINKLNEDYVHFVDDTPFWENHLIDGTNHMIKPLSSYETSGNECFFIFSNTFADKIKEKVVTQFGANYSDIYAISDFVAY